MHRQLDRFERVSLIIVIIVLLIALVVLALNDPGANRTIKPCKTFQVTLSMVDGKPKYLIDGEITPTLYLKHGKRYRFIVDAATEPIYLTTDEHGGVGMPGNFLNDKDGVVSTDGRGLAEVGDFDILLAREVDIGTFYYHSTNSLDVGGKIILH
jgi:hypothetical protein